VGQSKQTDCINYRNKLTARVLLMYVRWTAEHDQAYISVKAALRCLQYRYTRVLLCYFATPLLCYQLSQRTTALARTTVVGRRKSSDTNLLVHITTYTSRDNPARPRKSSKGNTSYSTHTFNERDPLQWCMFCCPSVFSVYKCTQLIVRILLCVRRSVRDWSKLSSHKTN
jgi:hypothetical protein